MLFILTGLLTTDSPHARPCLQTCPLLPRGALQQPASTVTAAEAADSIRRHQHQLHLPPLTLGASARHSSHWGGGHVAGSSPPSAGGHSSSTRWPLAPRSAHETPTWGQQEGGGLQLPHRTHSHTNGHTTVLAALSDRPPSLADLLGPYFLVLTTPQVADATLQVQVSWVGRRQLERTCRDHVLPTPLLHRRIAWRIISPASLA